MNIKPRKTVKESPSIDSFLLPIIILWWAQVTVAPELSKIAVFNRGTEKGLRGSTPNGGHITPISTEGDKLLWKKAQKKETKNNISDTINNKKPNLRPEIVALVWKPWNVDSLTTSFNQMYMQNPTEIKPKKSK